jgi:hypothetical protein
MEKSNDKLLSSFWYRYVNVGPFIFVTYFLTALFCFLFLLANCCSAKIDGIVLFTGLRILAKRSNIFYFPTFSSFKNSRSFLIIWLFWLHFYLLWCAIFFARDFFFFISDKVFLESKFSFSQKFANGNNSLVRRAMWKESIYLKDAYLSLIKSIRQRRTWLSESLPLQCQLSFGWVKKLPTVI